MPAWNTPWIGRPSRAGSTRIVEDKGPSSLISKAVMFLLGTEMDYQVDKLRSGLCFQQSEPDKCPQVRRVGSIDAGSVGICGSLTLFAHVPQGCVIDTSSLLTIFHGGHRSLVPLGARQVGRIRSSHKNTLRLPI